MTPAPPPGAGGNGPGPPPGEPEPLIRVGDDFEEEYPGASALATECYANLCRAGDLLMDLHNRQTRQDYQLSPSAREILAIIEGAGEALEPSVIAERLLITTGSMTSLLDTLQKRGLIRRLPHPGDRRKLLVDITPDAQLIVDEFLPSFHAREHELISSALTPAEQTLLLRLLAKIQQAAIQAGPAPPARDARRVRPDRTVNEGT
jgi:MarR family transcriptional regulator, 2-MHQ and catechol-resistance regulon repressor